MHLPNDRFIFLLMKLSYKNFKKSKREKLFFSVLALIWIIIFILSISFNSLIFILYSDNFENQNADFTIHLTLSYPSLTVITNLIHFITAQSFLKNGNFSLNFNINNAQLMNKSYSTSQLTFISMARITREKSILSLIPSGAYVINGSTYDNVSYINHGNNTQSFNNISLLDNLLSLSPDQNQSFFTNYLETSSQINNIISPSIIWISWDKLLSFLNDEQTLNSKYNKNFNGNTQIDFTCNEDHLQINLATSSLRNLVYKLENQSIQFSTTINAYINRIFNETSLATNSEFTFSYVQEALTLYSAIDTNSYLVYQIITILVLFLLIMLFYLISTNSISEFYKLSSNTVIQYNHFPKVLIGCIIGAQILSDIFVFSIGLLLLSFNNSTNTLYSVNLYSISVLMMIFLIIKVFFLSILLTHFPNTQDSSQPMFNIDINYVFILSGILLLFSIFLIRYLDQLGMSQIIVFTFVSNVIKFFIEIYLIILIVYIIFIISKILYTYLTIKYSLTYFLLILSGFIHLIKKYYKQKLLILSFVVTLLFINVCTISYYASITDNYQDNALFGNTELIGHDSNKLPSAIKYLYNLTNENPLCLTTIDISSIPVDLNGNTLNQAYSFYSNLSNIRSFLSKDIISILNQNKTIISSSLAEDLGLKISSHIIVNPSDSNTIPLNLTIGLILPLMPFIGIENSYWIVMPNQSTLSINGWFLFTHQVLTMNSKIKEYFELQHFNIINKSDYRPSWVYPINFLEILNIETIFLDLMLNLIYFDIIIDLQRSFIPFEEFLSIKGASRNKLKIDLLAITSLSIFCTFIFIGMVFGLNLFIYCVLFQSDNVLLSINSALILFSISAIYITVVQVVLYLCINFLIYAHGVIHNGINIVM